LKTVYALKRLMNFLTLDFCPHCLDGRYVLLSKVERIPSRQISLQTEPL
jgi:hypothetical protein